MIQGQGEHPTWAIITDDALTPWRSNLGLRLLYDPVSVVRQHGRWILIHIAQPLRWDVRQKTYGSMWMFVHQIISYHNIDTMQTRRERDSKQTNCVTNLRQWSRELITYYDAYYMQLSLNMFCFLLPLHNCNNRTNHESQNHATEGGNRSEYGACNHQQR